MKTLFTTFFFWTFGSFITLLYALVTIITYFVTYSSNILHHIGQSWGWVMMRICLSSVRVINPEFRSTVNEPVIWMCNHLSITDIFVFLGYVRGQYRFVSKEENFKIPFIGFAMRKAGYISISSDKPKKAAAGLSKSTKTIQDGTSIILYPEGERSKTGNILPLRRGAFRLAKASLVPIVIIRLQGTDKIMPPFQKNLIARTTPGTVTLEYLEIIPVEKISSLSEKELLDLVHEIYLRAEQRGNAST
jgi:1-acyl-sn-glycerol-3-phosphate acyltransferase